MPIRINLLAEAQALEEIRRKDPAKRAILVAVVLVLAVLVWSASLQVKLISDNARLSRLQIDLNNRTNDYAQVVNNQKKLADVNEKLTALTRINTNRFLQANLLNALMRTSVEGVQVTRLRLDQNFSITAPVPASTVDGRTVPAKPGGSMEKTTLTIDAKDSSPNPGDQTISQFKECIAHHPYFQQMHLGTNEIMLRNLSSPQVDAETGKPLVMFSFECRYPDRVR